MRSRDHKQRNLNKRYVNALKQFRGIATRYDKTAGAFLSMLLHRGSKAPDQSSEHGLADEPVPTISSLSILC